MRLTAGSSAMTESISTPRFMGPGCMTRDVRSGEGELLGVQAPERKYSRAEGTKAPSIRSS
jgi:hypothetical protein